jgi:hypothetical protein
MEGVIRLIDITRPEWIFYNWIEVTAYGDSESLYIKGTMRNPAGCEQAAKDWDIWAKAYRYVSQSERMK